MFQFEVLTINIIAEIVYVYGWLYNTRTCTWVSKVTYYTSMILYVIYSKYMLCLYHVVWLYRYSEVNPMQVPKFYSKIKDDLCSHYQQIP